MRGGGFFRWRPGQPTDDTGLTVAVTKAMLDNPDRPDLAAWDRMLDWFDGTLLGEVPPDVGGTTSRGLQGDPNPASLGNGSLMRTAPLALIADQPVREFMTWEIAAITHPNKRACTCCVAYVEIAAALVAGATSADAIKTGAATARRYSPTVATLITRAAKAAGDEAKLGRLLPDQAAGSVLDSLVLAVAALASGQPFDQALVDVIRWGRDTDTNGAIAGGLLGAYWGAQAIPARWADRLEWGSWLVYAADTLTDNLG